MGDNFKSEGGNFQGEEDNARGRGDNSFWAISRVRGDTVQGEGGQGVREQVGTT